MIDEYAIQKTAGLTNPFRHFLKCLAGSDIVFLKEKFDVKRKEQAVSNFVRLPYAGDLIETAAREKKSCTTT